MKGQVFTGDLLIGVIIFLVAFAGVLIFLTYSETATSLPHLVADGKIVSSSLTGTGELTIKEGGQVNTFKLRELTQKEYPDLKSDLNVRSDFCIFFLDLNGDIVNVAGQRTIGTNESELLVQGKKCGEAS